ncbi:MAG: diguanylate cyclase, partial [Marinobacter sp.]|nr:diguanylate cyclase [Marinobacter sp.]
QTANRIRQAIAATSVNTGQGVVHATISVGVATMRGAESIDRLLQRSDEALYRAKSSGRNRVCGYDNEAAA